MKKFLPATIFILGGLLTMGGLALAHGTTDTSNPMEVMMRQMMGDNAFDTMHQMEEQMMGKENHEKMEALMNKMLNQGLTQLEQKEMIELMQNNMTSPGTMTMMMRMMMPQMMQNSGLLDRIAVKPFHWSYWITMALVWILLVLGIVALWQRFIIKKKI